MSVKNKSAAQLLQAGQQMKVSGDKNFVRRQVRILYTDPPHVLCTHGDVPSTALFDLQQHFRHPVFPSDDEAILYIVCLQHRNGT
jgi:hypothetical protein